MRYTLFGRSGLRVSELCLGTMTFGEAWGWGAPKETCRRVFERLRRRGRHVHRLGEQLHQRAGRGDPRRAARGRARALRADDEVHAADASRRPELDRQPAQEPRPVAGGEPPRAPDRLHRRLLGARPRHVHAGRGDHARARRPGAARQGALRRRLRLAGVGDRAGDDDGGAARVDAVHRRRAARTRCSSGRPSASCCRWRAPSISPSGAFSPLSSGLLTGKYLADAEGGPASSGRAAGGRRQVDERTDRIVREVVAVAGEVGATPSQVALAWIRSRPGVVIPIVGVTSEEQLRDNLGCLDVALEPGAGGAARRGQRDRPRLPVRVPPPRLHQAPRLRRPYELVDDRRLGYRRTRADESPGR